MKVFFVGIKGVGMTGIATLYKMWGFLVEGSDTDEEFFTDEILKGMSIPIYSFDQNHIGDDIDRVIYSSAYSVDHPQLKRAEELGIPITSYRDILAEVFNSHKNSILVTGTHGKTTTSAMLGCILEDAALDPTVLVGGSLTRWGRTARGGKSDWVLAEGDEYQEKILSLNPKYLLLTNIEYDHPDYYPTEDSYRDVFIKLVSYIPEDGLIVAHESTKSIIEGEARARVIFYDKDEFPLGVWGEHNRQNATGARVLARELGIKKDMIDFTLGEFRGTKRRMELYTDADARTVMIDDYAHHPTEIRATLKAIREQYRDRHIIAVFQPHTYSRTKTFFKEFASSFKDADNVVIAEIYSSAREQEKTTSGRELWEAVKKSNPQALYAENTKDAIKKTSSLIQGDDVVIALGAGDVWRVVENLSGATSTPAEQQ
ncbi:MAG: Mur ligase domain-containing protein [bacterium]|nr:Mur ligase domain-containing protein [bacterium]